MLKHIGYSDLTKKYYFLDGKKGKVDITEDIVLILKHNSDPDYIKSIVDKNIVCPTCNKGELYTKNSYIWCKNKKCNAIFEQQDTLE